MFNPKVFLAEFIGTFALVFVGGMAGIYSGISSLGAGLVGVALAHGLTVAAFVYAFGHISGTYINPAVTLAVVLNGSIKWIEAVVYWVAQFSGAVIAALLVKSFITLVNPGLVSAMATSGVFTTSHPYYAMGLEALLTFFLANAVLHMAVDGKAGQFAGLGIGLTLTIAILAGGPLSGASLNPARSFGPAIFTSTVTADIPDFQNPMFYLIYFVGPFAGAVLAVLIYQVFKFEPASRAEMEDMDDDEIVEFVEEMIVEEPVKTPARKPAARKSASRKTTKK